MNMSDCSREEESTISILNTPRLKQPVAEGADVTSYKYSLYPKILFKFVLVYRYNPYPYKQWAVCTMVSQQHFVITQLSTLGFVFFFVLFFKHNSTCPGVQRQFLVYAIHLNHMARH